MNFSARAGLGRGPELACDLTFGRCLAVVADWAVTGTQSVPGVIVRPAQRREINFLVPAEVDSSGRILARAVRVGRVGSVYRTRSRLVCLTVPGCVADGCSIDLPRAGYGGCQVC